MVWCPRKTATDKAGDRHAPYLVWSAAGQLELTEGNSVDYGSIRAALRKARDEWGWDVQQIGLDPHNARYLCTCLAEEDHFVVFEHRQGFISMNDPIKQTTRLLLEHKLHHGGHQALAWCVANVVTRQDPAGNLKFDKEKSAEKIDPAVALVMGCGMAIAGKETLSFKRTGGLRVL
jgi:phage terminase large subunit-like protein